MFDHQNLTKEAFLTQNAAALAGLIGDVNRDLEAQYGSALQPLTPQDFWVVFFGEAAIDHLGHIDVDGRHSLGERGVLPLPSNIRFWVGPGAPDPSAPQTLVENLTHYAQYLGQLKNKVVVQRGGRDIYPGLFRHPGIAGNAVRSAKVLAGVVHGYFFGGNYSVGGAPDDALLEAYTRDVPIDDMLRDTTYVHAGTSILSNRQRNIERVLTLFEQNAPGTKAETPPAQVDGRYTLAPGDGSGLSQVVLRLDVDGPTALGFCSLEIAQGFPLVLTHIVAQIVADTTEGATRQLRAIPIYQAGAAWLFGGDVLRLGIGPAGAATLELHRSDTVVTRVELTHTSPFFDQVEFEVDVVEDAGRVHDTYDPGSHPVRPATLPAVPVSLERAFRDVGFDAQVAGHRSTIPISNAGFNQAWSNAELHDAMQVFWSRAADREMWAMWVVYAARHEDGRGLGGIMFDTLGTRHRQGTAIFTDSFIADVPFGDPNPEAWRRRMQIWTAVHEMGHGFNLAHSWEKVLGDPFPLTAQNEPEARSYMNYPFNVEGGHEAFFSDFEFRFSDRELLFMRHAPRQFVRMGGARWGANHGLHAPPQDASAPFRLEIRPNRDRNLFTFLEPVHLEIKLTNLSDVSQSVPRDILEDGHHVAIAVAREGTGQVRRRVPFMTACHAPAPTQLAPNASLYASHLAGASADGWLIDEPGFYTVQAAVTIAGTTVSSNVLRVYVRPPKTEAAHDVAPDFFEDGVARSLVFQGAPSLTKASATLQDIVERLPDDAVARHARLALAGPCMRSFKKLEIGQDRDAMRVVAAHPDLDQARALQAPLFRDGAEATAETLGHIQYRKSAEALSRSLAEAGEMGEAAELQSKLVETMDRRGVLPKVVQDSRTVLAVYSGSAEQADGPSQA